MASPTQREVQVMTIRVSREMHQGLKALAFASDLSVNEIVTRALDEFMASGPHRDAVDSLRERAVEYRAQVDAFE